ncbi:hypothetical protein SAMN05216344_10525 [Polaromonas sp. OV174]|uniref:hypothetical protein n=1 Tax=Polaromonas sp. OV174 TaxID=1855300 RepID=UPI0008F3BC0D|nr:hypothetical protein [Polaromonas sp. OV174]SFB89650.1 hypothetical protein SAMN05216344_10525 [Polaromonas sp. OV174]
MTSTPCHLAFDVAPYRLSDVVFGTLLNHEPAIAALDATALQPPYKALAKASVLRNTLIDHGDAVTVSADSFERVVQMYIDGATGDSFHADYGPFGSISFRFA